VRRLIQVPTIVLPNLILGENAIPELIQAGPERRRQPLGRALGLDQLGDRVLAQDQVRQHDRRQGALARLDATMRLPDGDDPSRSAARIVLAAAGRRVGEEGPERRRQPLGRALGLDQLGDRVLAQDQVRQGDRAPPDPGADDRAAEPDPGRERDPRADPGRVHARGRRGPSAAASRSGVHSAWISSGIAFSPRIRFGSRR
jgi:hypothetical protein